MHDGGTSTYIVLAPHRSTYHTRTIGKVGRPTRTKSFRAGATGNRSNMEQTISLQNSKGGLSLTIILDLSNDSFLLLFDAAVNTLGKTSRGKACFEVLSAVESKVPRYDAAK